MKLPTTKKFHKKMDRMRDLNTGATSQGSKNRSNMYKPLLAIALVASLLVGCTDKEQIEALNAEKNALSGRVDSLQTMVENQMYQADLLSDISKYLDSVETNRQWLRFNLESGVSEDDYIARMKRINQFLEQADYTIGELEKTRVAYLSQVRRLKKDLEEANGQIDQLEAAVDEWQQKATGAEEQLQLTRTELDRTRETLKEREADLASAQDQIQTLRGKVSLSQSETLFAKGQSAENVANKILFARKKKMEAYRTALDYYQQSLDMGYEPAEEKVAAMKEKLKITD